MLLLSVSPKLGALVAATPSCVLGGAGVVMFGMVVAAGVKVLGGAELDDNRNNLLIVAISVGVGMIPLVADKFFQKMPAGLGTLLHSGILLATFAAVALNLLFNGTGPRATRTA
jgi:NCS2 family nucleobase:cation symporter-2